MQWFYSVHIGGKSSGQSAGVFCIEDEYNQCNPLIIRHCSSVGSVHGLSSLLLYSVGLIPTSANNTFFFLQLQYSYRILICVAKFQIPICTQCSIWTLVYDTMGVVLYLSHLPSWLQECRMFFVCFVFVFCFFSFWYLLRLSYAVPCLNVPTDGSLAVHFELWEYLTSTASHLHVIISLWDQIYGSDSDNSYWRYYFPDLDGPRVLIYQELRIYVTIRFPDNNSSVSFALSSDVRII